MPLQSNHRIRKAREHLKKAEQRLKDTLSKIQETCKHKIVIEFPFRSYEYFGATLPVRVCTNCCLSEEGSVWSGGNGVWSKSDYKSSTLGNSNDRVVIAKSWEERWTWETKENVNSNRVSSTANHQSVD